ncbi:hypothetical protein COOONC_15423 [Cooperia oncophora]
MFITQGAAEDHLQSSHISMARAEGTLPISRDELINAIEEIVSDPAEINGFESKFNRNFDAFCEEVDLILRQIMERKQRGDKEAPSLRSDDLAGNRRLEESVASETDSNTFDESATDVRRAVGKNEGNSRKKDVRSCPECGKSILRKSLYVHLRGVHFYSDEQVEQQKTEMRKSAPEHDHVICPLCGESLQNQEWLALHCEKEHAEDGAGGEPQDYTVFTITFAAKQDFDEWLEECQQQANTTFYTRSSPKLKGTISLRCNRAGKYVKETENRATHTEKDVLHCSCFLNVKLEDRGRVTVRGCLGHVGHRVDTALLRLTAGQQAFLKALLEEFSHDYIIQRLRRDFPARTSRLHFVTKGDLWSLVNRFGLRPGFRYKDDVLSLKARQDERNPDDGIRLFNMPRDPSGEGFQLSKACCAHDAVLYRRILYLVIITPQQVKWLEDFAHRGICIDDTHNATRYNLKLATIMVMNERDTGLPAAFLLSGSMSSHDVEKLFLEVRRLVPGFDPAQIVTDEAPCFYNAFRSVFPNSRAKLHYCRWHVEKTWHRNANKLVEPRVRSRVKKMLRDILVVEDLPTFQQRFGQVLAFLQVEGQVKMEEYLRRNYLGRTPTWASFANANAIMDTSMISERWHLRLKTEFLHRNANSRADCLVDLLIRAVEELSQTDEIKVRRRLAGRSYRLQQTTVCHRVAKRQFDRRLVRIRQISPENWEVYTIQSGELSYVRRRNECGCSDNVEENVHCPLCSICPYAWSCSCPDNRSGISCRFTVYLQTNEHRIPSRSRNLRNAAELFEETITPSFDNEVSLAQERKEERSQIRNSINMKVSLLQSHVNALVNEDTEDAKNMLSEIEASMDNILKIRTAPLAGIAVRHELSKRGRKPKQQKVELYTVSASKFTFDTLNIKGRKFQRKKCRAKATGEQV